MAARASIKRCWQLWPLILVFMSAAPAEAASCRNTVEKIVSSSGKVQFARADYEGWLRDVERMDSSNARICINYQSLEDEYQTLLWAMRDTMKGCSRLQADCWDKQLPDAFVEACDAVRGRENDLVRSYERFVRDNMPDECRKRGW